MSNCLEEIDKNIDIQQVDFYNKAIFEFFRMNDSKMTHNLLIGLLSFAITNCILNDYCPYHMLEYALRLVETNMENAIPEKYNKNDKGH